ALEPGRDRAAGAGLLALRAAAGGLALARGAPASDPGPRDVRAVRRAEVVELHAFSSPSSSDRWLAGASPRTSEGRGSTRMAVWLSPRSPTSWTETSNRTGRTMPRVAGLSGTSTVCPIRFRPRARTVAR